MEVSSILGDRDHTDPPPLGPEDNTCSLSSEPIFIEVTHTQEVFWCNHACLCTGDWVTPGNVSQIVPHLIMPKIDCLVSD